MCASRNAINPNINIRSSEIINNTSPASENSIPTPNQNIFPCKPVFRYNHRNRQIITAGFATYSNLPQLFHNTSASSAAKTKARMS